VSDYPGYWYLWDPSQFLRPAVRARLGGDDLGQPFGGGDGVPHRCPLPATAGRVRAVAAQIRRAAPDPAGQVDLFGRVRSGMTDADNDRVYDALLLAPLNVAVAPGAAPWNVGLTGAADPPRGLPEPFPGEGGSHGS